MGTLLQVNVGTVQTFMIGRTPTPTAIVKTAVDGPIWLEDPGEEDLDAAVRDATGKVDPTGGAGVTGDNQGNRRVHGGRDMAVYAYDRAAYDWWEVQRGHDLPNGFFGENLTLAGVDVDGARLGERWRIGPVELEVRLPRIPCAKLEWRMQDRFIPDFLRADRPGAYLRVVTPGNVRAGDEVEVVTRPDHEVTVTDVLRLWRGDDVGEHVLTAGEHMTDDVRARATARQAG